MRGRLDDERISKAVVEATEEEVREGWAEGPYTAAQLRDTLGPCWVVNRHFGVDQNGKVRPIDDLSESFVNATVQTPDKIELINVDSMAAITKLWHQVISEDAVVVTLSTGEVLRGRRTVRTNAKLQGKCFDLEAAYKQFAVADMDAAASVIAVKSDKFVGGIGLFIARALPFGGKASVVGFNRAALAFRSILNKLFYLPALNYFDDYPIIVTDELAGIVDEAVKSVARIIGFRLKGGAKDKPFASTFKVLGVRLDLEQALSHAVVNVGKTPERCTALTARIGEILVTNKLSAAEASQLAGRLGFASGQLFGKAGASALWHLRRRAEGRGKMGDLSSSLAYALQFWRENLEDGTPKKMFFVHKLPPLLLFTDGFCDQEEGRVRAGYGGILIDPATDFAEAFGELVPDSLVDSWRRLGGYDRVVAQAEILPTIVARLLWRRQLSGDPGRRIVNFIDNDSARYGLLKGYSPTWSSAFLLGEFWRQEGKLQLCSRFERVPTKSNCADGPSRLRFDKLRGLWRSMITVVKDPKYFEDVCDGLLRRQDKYG